MPYVDEAIYLDETKDRFHASNHIVAILWEYIKPLIEETKEHDLTLPPHMISEKISKLRVVILCIKLLQAAHLDGSLNLYLIYYPPNIYYIHLSL